MNRSLINRTGLHASLCLLASFMSSAAFAAGETIVVTTLNDVMDFPQPRTVAQLPGPDGKVSFREAVTAANNTPGAQAIHFAIPQSEWWLIMDRALLRQENGAFILTDDETTVDFTTQTDFTGDTNPNGWEVGVYGLEPNAWGVASIYVNGNNCTIIGLDRVMQRGYGVRIQGNNNRVIGCTISGPLYAGVYINGPFNGPPASDNIVGGTEPGEGNVLSAGNSGVRIDGPAQNNIVIGNTLTGSFWGAEIRTPTCCPGNDAIDNRIGGPNPGERNIIAGAGKFGEEGFPTGGQVTVQYSTGNIVEGNYIGVNADGMTVPAIQRGPVGVEVRSSPGTIVRDNLIAGILIEGVNHAAGQRFGIGVHVMGNCEGTIVQGNQIGIGADGQTAIPNRHGIIASYWSVNGMPITIGPIQIGGPESGQGNTVANSETNGVRIDHQITRARITGNSIHSNGALGIDLLFNGGGAGVTPNDAGDGDTGGNTLQNFPVIESASSDGKSVQITGTLNSNPNSTFTVEFFASSECDPSGHGEGQQFIGSATVITNASGNADFDSSFDANVAPGQQATATATSSLGNTSEFSACREFEAAPLSSPTDLNGDGSVNVDDLLMLLANWGTCPGQVETCTGDCDGNGLVNVDDLLMLLADWS